MINIAIVSDIRLYREGIGRILDEEGFINIAAISETHEEISTTLDQGNIDLVLLDMRMANNNSVLTSILNRHPDVKIIVIATPENDENYLLCAQSGISGYLTKEATVNELKDAVKTVFNGSLYCPGSITQNILESIRHKHESNSINEIKYSYSKLLNILTQRETQVVKLVAEGLSNKQIASKLTIELSTVKNHVHNILVKMGVESRTKAACLIQETFSVHRDESLDLDT